MGGGRSVLAPAGRPTLSPGLGGGAGRPTAGRARRRGPAGRASARTVIGRASAIREPRLPRLMSLPLNRVPWWIGYNAYPRLRCRVLVTLLRATHRYCRVEFHGPVRIGPGF